MPSCACGGVRVCSVCTVSEISSLTKQKTTTPKKTRQNRTATTPRFIYTSNIESVSCTRDFDESDRVSNASVQDEIVPRDPPPDRRNVVGYVNLVHIKCKSNTVNLVLREKKEQNTLQKC